MNKKNLNKIQDLNDYILDCIVCIVKEGNYTSDTELFKINNDIEQYLKSYTPVLFKYFEQLTYFKIKKVELDNVNVLEIMLIDYIDNELEPAVRFVKLENF